MRAQRIVESSLLRLKWLAAATTFELAMRRHARALQAKYGYNPAQARDDHGRWTDAGGVDRRVRLAGDIPSGGLPEVPKEKPPTSRGRTAALKSAARFGGAVAKLIKDAEWLRNLSPLIETYRDSPKSLEELQQGVSEPGLGYDKHHIVEQTQAEEDGFSRDQIDSRENLVRIPRMKHWEINEWYQTANLEYGGETPRNYLRGRSWAVRRAVGLQALKKMGVLKP